MAKIVIDKVEGLLLSMEEIAKIPDEVQMKMIDAGAEILKNGITRNAEIMLRGPNYKGDVARSVKKKKPSKSGGKVTQTITFDGEVRDKYHKKGTRAGEIAFINEYGKKGQPARPFIAKAIVDNNDRIADAEAKVLDEYYKSKNL